MNEIALFVSTFGGAGLFIWFLINRDKTVSQEQTSAIKQLTDMIETTSEKEIQAINTLSRLINELLDDVVPSRKGSRRSKLIKEELNEKD